MATGIAVDAAGDAAVAGFSVGVGSATPTGDVLFGFRAGAGGTFQWTQKSTAAELPVAARCDERQRAGGGRLADDDGRSVREYRGAGAASFGASESPTGGAPIGTDYAIAIDQTGNAYVALTLSGSVGTSMRDAAGNWQPTTALSPGGVVPVDLGISTGASGGALLTYSLRTVTNADAVVQARFASTPGGSWARRSR